MCRSQPPRSQKRSLGTLGTENCLVDGLLDIFTPVTVAELGVDVLRGLTAKPKDVASY